MAVHSGKFGSVNGQIMVRNWTLEDVSTSQRIVHSGTDGGSFRLPGILDWTGTFEAYHPPTPDISNIIMPGDLFAFVGYTAPNDDVAGSTGVTYSGTAMVESVAITWDFSGGTPPTYTCNFASGAGIALVEDPVGAAIEDAAPVVPESICLLKVEVAPNIAVPIYVEWTDVTQAILTITSDVQTFVNSSTDCNTGRKAGPIDWSLALTEQRDAQLHGLVGTDHHFRLYTDDTSYWLLKLGHVESYTGLNVNRETGAIIEKTANLAMNGYDSAIDDYGRIAKPGTTTGPVWWGRDLP